LGIPIGVDPEDDISWVVLSAGDGRGADRVGALGDLYPVVPGQDIDSEAFVEVEDLARAYVKKALDDGGAS
jgi:hypothetical protein